MKWACFGLWEPNVAEFMEATVHQENTSSPDQSDYSVSDTTVLLDTDTDSSLSSSSSPSSSLSLSLYEDVSAGGKFFTDKEFAKDVIKQAQKENLGLTGPDGLPRGSTRVREQNSYPHSRHTSRTSE